MKYKLLIFLITFSLTYSMEEYRIAGLGIVMPALNKTNSATKNLENYILKKLKRQNFMMKTLKDLKHLEQKNPIEFIDFMNFCRKKLDERDPRFEKYKKIMQIIDELSFINKHSKFVNLCLNYLEF
ncbi:hypothetical protein M1446_03975 [Candidatus Dependentiae bacterium]|nr:hypothetical protein [Candidatus Dependentiae bacterium]